MRGLFPELKHVIGKCRNTSPSDAYDLVLGMHIHIISSAFDSSIPRDPLTQNRKRLKEETKREAG